MQDHTWSALPEQNRRHFEPSSAVILDVDETVLDNSAFDARLVTHRTTFSPSAWDAWVREADARAVPGALDFIAHARKRGVTILFITNRQAHQEALDESDT